MPLRETIPHIVAKNQIPGHNRSAVIDFRVTSCFAAFDKKVTVNENRRHGRSF